MKVVLTRPAGRGAELAGKLRAAGHQVAHAPLTSIRDAEPFPDPAGFDGVLFTSVSAVDRAPADVRWPRVGAVGDVTAEALRRRGIAVDVEGGGGGTDLARAWGGAEGQRLLLPQAIKAHPALAEALRAAGAEVVCVPVYETIPVEKPDRVLLAEADLICFFAPSAVRAFRTLDVRTRAKVWAHGPTTRAAVDEVLQGDLDVIDDLL
ncbi:MAG: uroporphyrinogen-III synthase [Planctomycetota bacterium]